MLLPAAPAQQALSAKIRQSYQLFAKQDITHLEELCIAQNALKEAIAPL
jgi:hypothetical protein